MNLRYCLRLGAPALLLCWAAMSIYNLTAGDSGVSVLGALNREIAAEADRLESLRAEREALEFRADRLASKSMDGDLADERIRAILGYAEDGETVVPARVLEKALASAE